MGICCEDGKWLGHQASSLINFCLESEADVDAAAMEHLWVGLRNRSEIHT